MRRCFITNKRRYLANISYAELLACLLKALARLPSRKTACLLPKEKCFELASRAYPMVMDTWAVEVHMAASPGFHLWSICCSLPLRMPEAESRPRFSSQQIVEYIGLWCSSFT